MAGSNGDDAARLAVTVTRLERRVEELTVEIARQESKLDQLLSSVTPDAPTTEQSLHELATQLVNVTIETNRLLKRVEGQLGHTV